MVRRTIKIIAVAIVLSLATGLFSCVNNNGNRTVEDPSLNINYDTRNWITNSKTEFDENKIVLSFAALADTHQEMGNEAKSQRMIKVMKYRKRSFRAI